GSRPALHNACSLPRFGSVSPAPAAAPPVSRLPPLPARPLPKHSLRLLRTNHEVNPPLLQARSRAPPRAAWETTPPRLSAGFRVAAALDGPISPDPTGIDHS